VIPLPKQGELPSVPLKRRCTLLALVSLIWVFAVYFAYYIVHKPFTPGQAVRIAGVGLDLLLLVLLVLVAAAWGRRLSRWLRLEFASLLEQFVFSSGIGFGVLGYAVLGLGSLGLLYRWICYVLLLALAFSALGELRFWSGWLVALVRRVVKLETAGRRWQVLLSVYVLVLLAITLSRALMPPTAWDALVYHLEVPRHYLAQHRIVPIDDFFYANLPQLMEMFYLLGLLLEGDVLAQLVHFSFAILLVAAVFSAARQFLPRTSPLLAVALFLSVPVITTLAAWAYIDLCLTFFLFCALYALFRWRANGSSGWLSTSAAFVGLALAVKYTAALWLVSLLVAIVWEHRGAKERRPRPIAGSLLRYGLIVLAVAWPFYLKNLLFTGNPVYPYIFGGKDWNSLREAWLTSAGHGLGNNPLDYLLLPWNMTINGVQGSAAFDATISPFLLALLPLIIILGVPGRVHRYLLFFVGVQLAFLAFSAYHLTSMLQTRMVLVIFPLLCLLAAHVLGRLNRLDTASFSLQRFAYLVVGVTFVLNLWSEVSQLVRQNAAPYLAGLETRQAYLSKTLGDYYQMAAYVNENLPPLAVVALWWEPRGYYLRQPVLADPTLDAFPQLVVENQGEPQRIADALVRRGVSYILLSQHGLEFLEDQPQYPLAERDLEVLDALQRTRLDVVHADGGYVLYSLKTTDSDPPSMERDRKTPYAVGVEPSD